MPPLAHKLSGQMEQQADEARLLMRKIAMNMMEADANDDDVLDRDEFMAMLPQRVRDLHTQAEIQSWFDMVDVDRKGSIRMDEFCT